MKEGDMRAHSEVKPKNFYINLNSKGDGHHGIISDKLIDECEIGDYNPEIKISTTRMTTGVIEMKHQSSRKKLGSGRP